MLTTDHRPSTTVTKRSSPNASPLLTVIVPVFNEANSLVTILDRVQRAPYDKQIIVVDDGSSDGTTVELKRLAECLPIKALFHEQNRGKDAAIRTALEHATGQYTIIQDEDLEYDPQDYPKLVEPLLAGEADVVYGSRYLNKDNDFSGRRRWRFDLGVKLLSLAVRLLYGVKLTDEATCYKVFPTYTLRSMDLQCERFEFCPELTAKTCRLGLKACEVRIRYSGRRVSDSKKIRLRNGLEAIIAIFRYSAWRPVDAILSAWGMLLLVAGTLKAYQVYIEPMSTLAAVGTVVIVCLEACLGAWLLFGSRTLWAWRAAVICFGAFAVAAGYNVFLGEASCGCFGAVKVDPRIMFGVDVLAVVSLLSCRRNIGLVNRSTSRSHLTRFAFVAFSLMFITTTIAALGQSQFTQSDGFGTVAGQLVLLDPESWVGELWPLLSESGLESELAVGKWDVLLFRHDCHVCHDVMLELEHLLSTQTDKPRIALIGIDEPRDEVQLSRLQELGCIIGHLPQDRVWFVTTPLRLSLEVGECVALPEINRW
jgi:hypothetical protein